MTPTIMKITSLTITFAPHIISHPSMTDGCPPLPPCLRPPLARITSCGESLVPYFCLHAALPQSLPRRSVLTTAALFTTKLSECSLSSTRISMSLITCCFCTFHFHLRCFSHTRCRFQPLAFAISSPGLCAFSPSSFFNFPLFHTSSW